MFGRKCSIIGVVHLKALPGSPDYCGNMQEILAHGVLDAGAYKDGGVDAILVENMHDVPYFRGSVPPETTAAMTILASAIKYDCMMPVGIQILAGASQETLAAAVAAELDFMRVEGFVYAHIGDEGIHQSNAAELMRKRSYLQAKEIKIFADIKKKHSSHALTNDVSLVETAQAAEMFGADGVVVTGRSTGSVTDLNDVQEVRANTHNFVLVGSGVNEKNVQSYLPYADALIVGSAMKVDGHWANKVDTKRVEAIVKKAGR